jgi:hypothetical protein
MNKLSELSKPVAYTDADELRFHHATSDMWPTPLGFGKDAPLYSQEYVSALLDVAIALREWIDAVPDEVAASLPTMPGVDRDWVDSVIGKENRNG